MLLGLRVLSVGVGLSFVLIGCAGSPGSATGVDPSRTSTQPSTSTDPQAAIKAEVLRVYAQFMDARNASFADPRKGLDPRMRELATPQVLEIQRVALAFYRRQGIRIDGVPVSHPSSPTVEMGVAKLTDCVDNTDSQPVFVKTGKSALAPGQPRRISVPVEMKIANTAWRVSQWLPRKGTTC